MAENSGYPPGTADWKMEAVDWLFNKGLLSEENWKAQIEKPLPLWAQAAIYQRLFQKLKGEVDK